MPTVLSEDEIRRYHAEGFLVPSYRLPAAQVARLRTATDRLIAERPELVDHPIIGPHLPGGGMHGLYTDSTFRDIATHPEVLDVIEQLIGPDLILWNALLFYKRAEAGPKVPWHRDGFGYPIEPIATTSIWIAVTESSVDNGCLRFIPGSHRTTGPGVHDSTPKDGEMFSGSLDPATFDECAAVDAALEPGQFVIFDVYTIHGSQPNTGGPAACWLHLPVHARDEHLPPRTGRGPRPTGLRARIPGADARPRNRSHWAQRLRARPRPHQRVTGPVPPAGKDVAEHSGERPRLPERSRARPGLGQAAGSGATARRCSSWSRGWRSSRQRR